VYLTIIIENSWGALPNKVNLQQMKQTFTYPLLCIFMWLSTQSYAQEKEYVYQTFKDTRVINTYSVETLQKSKLDIRITHRFGDVINQGTWQGAWSTFFGFETAADVAFGLEYGITNNLTIGFHRAKGFGPLKSNLHGLIKYKVLSQTKGKSMPISMALAGSATISTMWESSNPELLSAFNQGANDYKRFSSRLSYSFQVHMARKFGNAFSLQLSPTFVWRNLVRHDDTNYLISTGICAKLQVTKMLGIIIDANIPFDITRLNGTNGFIPLGIGFEFDTGGHIFQVNFTNSAGIEPTDYIPYTTLDWLKGQFRLGFTISRAFRM